MEKEYFDKIYGVYTDIKGDIEKRLEEFKEIWFSGNNEDIHIELSFCILTPQSKARNAWKAITALRDNRLLFTGEEEDIVEYLNVVRFKNNKAKNLVLLREQMKNSDGSIITKDFIEKIGDVFETREWLVKHVRGIAYKEASHFLRNVGFGDDIAILDRHILRNLVRLGVIEEIPKTITGKKYKEIEEKMRKYCSKTDIPMDNFDLLLWYLEAGEIFK
jgi:N-glycosylase/DNA lyase